MCPYDVGGDLPKKPEEHDEEGNHSTQWSCDCGHIVVLSRGTVVSVYCGY